jgi:hypothetical protein
MEIPIKGKSFEHRCSKRPQQQKPVCILNYNAIFLGVLDPIEYNKLNLPSTIRFLILSLARVWKGA